MSARGLAKKIRKELDRREREQREHGRVSAEKVKAVKEEVRSLVEEIKADFPEIGLSAEGERRHQLSDGKREYVLVTYGESDVTIQEFDRGGDFRSLSTFSLFLNQDEEWTWSNSKDASEVKDLADFIVALFLRKLAAGRQVSLPATS